MGLRQLDADRAGSDDDEVLGQPVDVENRLVRQVGHGGDARDRRDRRLRPCRDDDAPGADCAIAGADLARPDKARLGADHLDPEPLEALDRIMRRDRVHDAAHVPANRGKIDLGRRAIHSEAAGGPHRMRRLCRGEQRLRRHAAGIEAFAAHLGPFDQHGARAELGGDCGRRQPGGAGPDHADIDAFIAHRTSPVRLKWHRRRLDAARERLTLPHPGGDGRSAMH